MKSLQIDLIKRLGVRGIHCIQCTWAHKCFVTRKRISQCKRIFTRKKTFYRKLLVKTLPNRELFAKRTKSCSLDENGISIDRKSKSKSSLELLQWGNLKLVTSLKFKGALEMKRELIKKWTWKVNNLARLQMIFTCPLMNDSRAHFQFALGQRSGLFEGFERRNSQALRTFSAHCSTSNPQQVTTYSATNFPLSNSPQHSWNWANHIEMEILSTKSTRWNGGLIKPRKRVLEVPFWTGLQCKIFLRFRTSS